MPYYYGTKSRSRLRTCHKDIQTIFNEAIIYYDISILEGVRSDKRQLKLYKEGKSKLDGFNKKSKHQPVEDENGKMVSFAVDVMPYKKGTNPFSGDERDNRRFYYLAGIIKIVSEMLYEWGEITHKIRWGGDWDSDDVYTDQTFNDLSHFELIK